jgi:two-component system, cell cycle sensor histidine kinase and response regulator CckA
MFAWLKSRLPFLAPDEAQPLQVRLYRIFTGLTAWMCLLTLIPVNTLETTPVAMNAAILVLGTLGWVCFAFSRRGQHFYGTFFVTLIVVIDVVWFMDAGSRGGVTFCFFAILVYPVVIFRGWKRVLALAFFVLDLEGIYQLDYYRPAWALPFSSD